MKNIYILTPLLLISLSFGLYTGPHQVNSQYESYQNSPKERLKYENNKHGIQYCKVYDCWYEEGNCELDLDRTVHYDKNGKLSSDESYKYDYDSNNNIINEYYYSDVELYRIYNYKYDFNNNQIERRTVDSNGDLLQKLDEGETNVIKLKYDPNDNLIEKSEYRNEDLFLISTYKYDSLNNMIEEKDVNQGYQLWKYSYRYDSYNRIIEKRLEDDYWEQKYYYNYDSNNNVIEILYFDKGMLIRKTTYKYNNSNHIIEEIEYDVYGKEEKEVPRSKHLYEYKYY